MFNNLPRRAIRRRFKKIGVTQGLQFLNNGESAIKYMMGEGEYADRGKFPYPSFIMTDLKMPVVDGFYVLEFLKGNPEWAIIPTVVLSASDDPDDIKKCYLLGASSYHVKSGNCEELAHQFRVLHDYWMTCKVPEVDASGRQLRTDSIGRLGERIRQAGDEGMPLANRIRRLE